jgi:hypothetical protein
MKDNIMNTKNKISRQRKWQLKKTSLGLCEICGKPVSKENKNYCKKHRLIFIKRLKQWKLINKKKYRSLQNKYYKRKYKDDKEFRKKEKLKSLIRYHKKRLMILNQIIFKTDDW